MRRAPGTYVLLLSAAGGRRIRVGKWGHLQVKKGYYLYVGSAFGPGGIGARVERHWSRSKGRHWHMDYLRLAVVPTGVWYSHHGERLEHRWARALEVTTSMSPIRGFGSSDCGCHGHLFFTTTRPDLVVCLGTTKPKIFYEPLAGSAKNRR